MHTDLMTWHMYKLQVVIQTSPLPVNLLTKSHSNAHSTRILFIQSFSFLFHVPQLPLSD